MVTVHSSVVVDHSDPTDELGRVSAIVGSTGEIEVTLALILLLREEGAVMFAEYVILMAGVSCKGATDRHEISSHSVNFGII